MNVAEGEGTRWTLLQRLSNSDDAEAWEEFVRIYAELIRKFLRLKGIPASDVDDLCQETLSKVMNQVRGAGYDREKRFRAWLYVVVKNQALEHLESAGRRPLTGQDELWPNVAGKVVGGRVVDGMEPADAEFDWWERETLASLVREALDRTRQGVSEKSWRAFEIIAVTRENRAEGDIYWVEVGKASPDAVSRAAQELGWDKARVAREKSNVLKRFNQILEQLISED